MTNLKWALCASAALAVCSLVTSDAAAGDQAAGYEGCSAATSTKLGSCTGTFSGYHNGANPSDYAEFAWESGTNGAGASASFAAQQNGNVLYTCTVSPTNTKLIGQFQLASSGALHEFKVYFDTAGHCTSLTMWSDSVFDNTW
jgi:hypothetical protein